MLVGVCAGSFVATAALRLPDDPKGLLRGRSACRACGAPLRARELVPLLSWLFQRTRCRHCGTAIPVYYPLVEITAGAIGVTALGLLPPLQGVFAAGLGWWLLVLALIDLRSFELPDALTLPLLGLGLGIALAVDLQRLPLSAPAPLDAALGAGMGWAGLWLVSATYRALRGRDGLGLGDAKLLGAAGAWLGVQALPLLLLIGAAATLAAALLGRQPLKADTALPLGPGLAAAFWLLYLVAPPA